MVPRPSLRSNRSSIHWRARANAAFRVGFQGRRSYNLHARSNAKKKFFHEKMLLSHKNERGLAPGTLKSSSNVVPWGSCHAGLRAATIAMGITIPRVQDDISYRFTGNHFGRNISSGGIAGT